MKTRIFINFIVVISLFLVVLIPKSIAWYDASLPKDSIQFSVPNGNWRIYYSNIDANYTVEHGLHNVDFADGVDIVNSQYFKFIDKGININAFAVKGPPQPTSNSCFELLFNHETELKYGSWINKKIINVDTITAHRGTIPGHRDFRAGHLDQIFYDLSLTSMDDLCVGVVIDSSLYSSQDYYDRIPEFLNINNQFPTYPYSADEYINMADLSDSFEDKYDNYGKAFDILTLNREENFDKIQETLFKTIDMLFARNYFSWAKRMLKNNTEILKYLNRESSMQYFGLGMAHFYLNDPINGERFLRHGFNLNKNLAEFPKSDDPNFKVYQLFKQSLFNEYKIEYYGVADKRWYEWIENYDFSTESINERFHQTDIYKTEPVISPNGTKILPYNYDYFGEFKNGYAAVHPIITDDNGWCLIDEFGNKASVEFKKMSNYSNNLILAGKTSFWEKTFYHFDGTLAFQNPIIKNAEWFNNGIAAVEDENGQYFHIDKTGKPIYSARFSYVGTMNKGIAVAEDENSQWFHINQKGEPLYSEKFDMAEDFNLGVARVQIDSKVFYINKNGEAISDAQSMGEFAYGAITATDESGGMFHIDRIGNRLYQGTYLDANYFTPEGAYVTDFGGTSYIINKKGIRISRINPKTGKAIRIARDSQPLYKIYDWVSSPVNGISTVQDKNGKWFHVYQNGDRLYQQDYKWVDDFNDKLAKVLDSDNKWRLIDIKGNDVMNEAYTNIGKFINDIALATNDKGELFYINKNGNKLNKTPFLYATEFSEERAAVADEKRNMFHINTSGKRIYSQNYMSVSPYKDNKAIARDFDGNWFYIDLNGEIIENENPFNNLDFRIIAGNCSGRDAMP